MVKLTSSIGQKMKITKRNFRKSRIFAKKLFKTIWIVGLFLAGLSCAGWCEMSAQEINTGPGRSADLEWQKFLEASPEADVIFEAKIQEILVAPMGFDMG